MFDEGNDGFADGVEVIVREVDNFPHAHRVAILVADLNLTSVASLARWGDE